MANTDISLLFGVLGKGSLSGASGKLIKSQLTQIMAELNKTPLKVKVGIDTASGGGRSWSGQLQQKLDQISANGKFSAQISTLKLSPGAVSDFKKQLAAVVNTVGLSTGTQITISAAGIGEIKSKLKDAQDAIKKTGIDADEASRKIAEFKVQMEALSSQKKTVKQSIDALGKIASTEAEKTQVSEISARYEKWAIEIEKVRAAKAALPAGQRAAIEAEGAAILSNIERINAERIAREDAARAAENAEKNMAAASKRRLKEDAAAQAQKNAALKAGSALLAQMEKAERDWTAARNGSSKISYSRLLGDIAALKKYNIQLYTDTKTVEEFRRNLILLQRSFSSNSNVIKSAGENVRTFGSRIGGLAQKFSAWLSVSQLIMLGIRSVRRMISVTIELDDAMTQLKIVTRDTSQVFDAYLGKITETASRIGASVSDLIDSTTTFARLGYSLTESSSLAEFTAMLQNVGDIDTDAAQDAITAIIKAFGVSVDDIESIMDKLVITGNNFPISVAQIAEGMNNASSALAAAGNTFDQSVALLTAANTTIQNAAKSSTGLRTIVARLRSTKTELDELGEAMTEAEYDELVAALSKYNVSLTNAAGEFRSTYDIVADIASVWDDLSSMEQAALANIIAGVRQQSVFYSLIEQFQEAAGAMNDMENSAGTLQKSYKTFMESITAHINQFKAAFQSFSQSTFTTNFMNGIIDLGTNVLKILDSISRLTNVVGGLNTVLYVTAGIIATIKADSIFTQLVRLAAPIKAIIATLQTARAAGVKTGQFISNAFNQIAVSVSTAQIAIGGVVLAIAAIAGAAAIYKALHKSTEELVEISNELKDSFREVKEQAEDNISTLQSLSDEFTRLADGVDRYGRNISLSANDYERYKEIIEQIVGISPELIDGYDKENGYLVDKNNLLERAIALQEEEYRNELRRMTTTSNISTAVAGAAAIYADLESDEALKAGSSLTNAIYRLFNVNSRDDIPKEMESGEFLARQIMEALGVENVDKELEKYFNEHRYWQSDWFFDDYIDQIAKDIGSSRSLILPHIDFEAAGFESSDAFVNAVEEVKSAASEYSDVQSELTQANQDISDQLKLVAESNQQYANLSANAREIISDFVNSFGVNDITKAGWFGGKVIDEDAINRIKVEINDFVEKFTPEIQELVDTGFSLQLGFDVDGGELLIEDYRRKVSKLLNSIDDVEDKDLQLYIRTSLGIDEDSTTLNNDIEKAIAHVKNLLVDTPVDKSELENLLTWYKQEINDAKELGVDLNKTVYGNIDTNNRQILEWTEDNLEQYRDVIDSWRFNDELLEDVMESLRGSTSTIMGTSENFDGVEIAFSPILQTENGAVYLDRDTLHQYINDLIEKAGSNWTSDDLLRLDAEGLEYDGMRIQNMLADVGETAINTGESMHFAGNLGGIQTAYSELREAALNAGMTVEELNNAIENGDFDKLRTVQEIVDSLSVDKALHIYYNISADPHSMTFDDLQKKLDLLGVDWSKTINVWDFSPMVESLGDIESKVSDVVSAMNSLQNGTRLTAEEIAKLALKYPDLLKASNLFTDTSIENQKTLLDSILGTYESEYDALVDTKIAELTATNKLIENQINLENEKKNKVIEIADLQSNGKLDSERDYQKLLDELHDLEGQNFVTFSDGVLDVNEDMLKKMLKNDGKSVDASKPIWGALGNMILEGHADGLGEALKAFPQYLAKLKDWAGSSLKTLLSNIGTNIGKALSGNTDFVSLGDGIQSIGTVSAGNVTIETIVEGNYTIDGESVDEWTADYKNVIESRVKTLTDQITANEIIVNNLKSMKGLDLKSLYGGSGSTSRNGKTDNEGQDKLEEYIADIDTYYEALKRLEAIQIRLSALENALEHTTSEREKIGLTEQLIRVYKDEIDALETLNGLRKDTIQNSIKELQALGFEIDYNSDSNEFLVRNLEHLNELEGKTLEETNELRKGTEELINTLDDLNAANQDSVDSMADFCAEIEQSKQRIID